MTIATIKRSKSSNIYFRDSSCCFIEKKKKNPNTILHHAVTKPAIMVTLNDRQDWYAWDQMIRSHIRDAQLEGVILEGTEELMRLPRLPSMWVYVDRYPRPLTDTIRKLLDQNPRGSQIPASTLKELVTPEGYMTYLQDMIDFKRRKVAQQKQEEAYLRIKNIFLRTVSERLQPRYLHDDKDLRHWYRSLHDNVVGTRVEQLLSVREEYRRHVSVIDPKATNSWEHWLDKWQEIMTKAVAVNLQEGETAAFWIADLRKVFRSIIPHWAETVGLAFDEEIENNTLQPRRIARQLRAILGHKIVSRPSLTQTQPPMTQPPSVPTKQKIAKAAPGQMLGEESPSDVSTIKPEDTNAVGDHKEPSMDHGPSLHDRIKPAHVSKPMKRKAHESGSGAGSRCQACDVPGHSWMRCHYVFKDVFKTPSWFIEKAPAVEYYQKRREEDPTWAAEVDREIARQSSK